jgi:squalene-hopene/tetraprenyl-beta-curcumene cyclase
MRLLSGLLVVALIVLGSSQGSLAAEKTVAKKAAARNYGQMVNQGIAYLQTRGQAADGSYSKQVGPAVTALCTTALLRHGRSPDDPTVAKSLKYLESFVKQDGGIYLRGTVYRNYDTCLSLICFAAANKDGRYDKLIKGADGFVKKVQWDEEEGKTKADFSWGGAGYGKYKRPDLSNTAYLIEALKAAGNGADSEAMKRALIFVSRCQNLETEHNQTPNAAKNPDGGFYYTGAGEGESKADRTATGGLRSYASMTYAGLKSMIFAGVGPDDPRVKAAYTWAQKNYDLKSNPGMGASGLYYYYHTFAKTLDAIGEDTIADAEGVKHDWRKELIAELASRQNEDGSWVNKKSPRWIEGDPNLVTGYALLALSYCKVKAEKK